jgi:hypothetical protein
MQRCREHRIRRRENPAVIVVDALRAGPQFKCKMVACWCCRTAQVKRKKALAAAVFADVANAHCSFVTVNAAMPCDDLDGVAAAHTKMVNDLDNLRDGLSRRDRRYARMSIFAILEVPSPDEAVRIATESAPSLPPTRLQTDVSVTAPTLLTNLTD